jgi:ribosomal protein S18 acetylase RimI-like enzyme
MSASPADEQLVVSAIVMAFSSDPAARWVYPEPHQYLKHFPEFVTAFGGKALAHGSAYFTEGGAAAALWLPPGVEPDDEQLTDILARSVPKRIREDVFTVFEQMGSYHPREPHWYLPMIGVDVTLQGRGFGSALLKHALSVCDESGHPAYLESSSPRNIPLYERHGFKLLGTIQVGSSPPIFPMLRQPLPANGTSIGEQSN